MIFFNRGPFSTDDEMFTDTYPMEDIDDAFYMVKGKSVVISSDDIQLDGANPSAEDGAEDTGELKCQMLVPVTCNCLDFFQIW